MSQKVTIKMTQKINELYDNGWILKEIAEDIELSITTVGRYVWNPRTKGTRSFK